MDTPNANLPPIGDGPRRKMIIEIEVTEDFEKRLDNQWMVEREINADRWSWKWATDYTDQLHQRDTALVKCREALELAREALKAELNTPGSRNTISLIDSTLNQIDMSLSNEKKA